MKNLLVGILFLLPSHVLGQADTLSVQEQVFSKLEATRFTDKELSKLNDLLRKAPECRTQYLNDSVLQLLAKNDAEVSMSQSVKKYYRIGHAGGILIKETQELALNQHKLWIEYTHCTPCKYQLEYNKAFEALYQKKHQENVRQLVHRLEEEVWEKAKTTRTKR